MIDPHRPRSWDLLRIEETERDCSAIETCIQMANYAGRSLGSQTDGVHAEYSDPRTDLAHGYVARRVHDFDLVAFSSPVLVAQRPPELEGLDVDRFTIGVLATSNNASRYYIARSVAPRASKLYLQHCDFSKSRLYGLENGSEGDSGILGASIRDPRARPEGA